MAKFTLPAKHRIERVSFSGLAGVDLAGDSSSVSRSRGARCVNMYKSYTDGLTDFIETRPGFSLLRSFEGRLNGVWFLRPAHRDECLLHLGSELYRWVFPGGTPERIGTGLSDTASFGFSFGKTFYLTDGTGYYVYAGDVLETAVPTVPVTSIGRSPAGAGQSYQPVNMLTAFRVNTFRADGVSTSYYLDAPQILTTGLTVTVDGQREENFTVDTTHGRILFDTPPAAASGGADNVHVTFCTAQAPENFLLGCRIGCEFDSRIFLSGNPLEKNRVIHCELSDPLYFADNAYYNDGSADSAVTALCPDGETLLVFKNGSGGESSLYRHQAQVDYDLGRIYPAYPAAVTVGCSVPGGACCFLDDIVYLSARGLEGLGTLTDALSTRALGHRSTMIDPKLLTENFAGISMAQWGSYLCLLCEGRMYLADGRNIFKANDHAEYEWFYWEGLCVNGSPAVKLAVFDGALYFVTRAGDVCRVGGTSDNGAPIESCFETRFECAGDFALRKTVRKKGASALFKNIPNGAVTVSVFADSRPEQPLCTCTFAGLAFDDFYFDSLTFAPGDDNSLPLPLDVRDFRRLKLKFASDRRFGLGAVRYNAELIDYTK